MAFACGYGGFDFTFRPLGAQNPRLVIDTEDTNPYVVSILTINNSITDKDIVLTWACLEQTEFLLKVKDSKGVTVHEKQLVSADKFYCRYLDFRESAWLQLEGYSKLQIYADDKVESRYIEANQHQRLAGNHLLHIPSRGERRLL